MARSSADARPPVAVVVPFYGSPADAGELRAALERIALRDGDEIVVADNTEDGRFGPGAGRIQAVRAPLERSSYYARNVGVEATRAEWILFVDADCRPDPAVLDAYFDPPPGERAAVVSGSVHSTGEAPTLAAVFATDRGHIDPDSYPGKRPTGVTANMLVRRRTWEALGGFHEGLRSGGDVEFCWRAQDAGWTVERRTAAVVEHAHPESLAAMRSKATRHSSGVSWLLRRRPGSVERLRPARELPRALAGAAGFPLLGQRRRGLYKALDGLMVLAELRGRTLSNAAVRDATAPAPPPGRIAVRAEWPAPGDRMPDAERVETLRRPGVGARELRRRVRTDVVEDESPARRLADLGWILRARPQARRHLADWRAAGAARRAVERGDRAVLIPDDPEAAAFARSLARLAGLDEVPERS